MKKNLYVVYRDELGTVLVETDGSGIHFLENEMVFSTENEIFKIKTENVVEIYMG